jgi:hypothetical protein
MAYHPNESYAEKARFHPFQAEDHYYNRARLPMYNQPGYCYQPRPFYQPEYSNQQRRLYRQEVNNGWTPYGNNFQPFTQANNYERHMIGNIHPTSTKRVNLQIW